MNRPAPTARLPRLILCLVALVFVGVAMPAHAVNDWYKVGYSEGYLRQEQICQQQLQQRISAQFEQISSENQRLRQELIRLRQIIDSQQGGNPQLDQQALGQSATLVRDDSMPQRSAANVMSDDDSGG